MTFSAGMYLTITALSLTAGGLISVALGQLPTDDRSPDDPPDRSFASAAAASLGAAFWSCAVLPEPLSWAGCALGWVLIAAAMIDLRHYWLPDPLILPLVPAGLVVSWLTTGAVTAQGIGVVAGYASVSAIRRLYRMLRGREGIGLGDAKLLAAAGAWVGWAGLPSVVLIAAITALSVSFVSSCSRCCGTGDAPIAFGPYLALGFWIVWLHGPLQIG
ncbi:A24 family peptidase (plasmid) [Skermanella rosea]|uniref:prepilin peptidase n=1 Tax=Skermanella rosea TaxID=1817965 RepID=UPI001931755D|nr:A24 family peptidase [Skermanella rosea]UEM07195.1 A24 family peptidase [Skermanella rosea]